MEKGSLLFVPVGGLANRMRAVASAYNLAQHTGVKLRVVWFRDWALSAKFKDIFEPIEGLDVHDASSFDLAFYDRPRRKNFYFPRFPQALIFQQRIDEQQVTPLNNQGFDFEAWAKGKKSWMSCYSVFGAPADNLYREIFQPVKAVMNKVDYYQRQFSPHTIGFHIRRTDNQESIDNSPIELFIQAGEKEIAANPDTKIFLATDDEATKTALKEKFRTYLITPPVRPCAPIQMVS